MLPEQRLVLAAARSAFSSEDLSAHLAEVEAAFAIHLADGLGVLGLVSNQLRSLPGADPLWAKAWRANLARNMMLVDQLRCWYDRFRSAGIQAISIKGPVLARLAFGSLGSRDSCDLDFVVPFGSFRRAVTFCTELGAVPFWRGPLPSSGALGAATLLVPESRNTYALDLHAGWLPVWGSREGRHIDEDEMCDVFLPGGRIQTLGLVLTLIHAAAHFTQHRFSLKTLLDVVALQKRAEQEGLMDGVRSRARRLGAHRVVAQALRAVEEFVALGYVPSLRHRLGSPESLAAPAPSRRDLRTWLEVRRNLSPGALLSAALKRMWIPADELRWTSEWVGPEHLWLRRLLRPVRLLAQGAHSLWPQPTRMHAAWRSREPLRGIQIPGASDQPSEVESAEHVTLV